MLRARKLASTALTTCLITMGGIGTTVLSAGAADAATCPTASQIVTDINTITSEAGGINSTLSPLTSNSAPGTVQSAGQFTGTGLNSMSSDFSVDTDTLSGCSALGTADSTSVANAFDSLAGTTNQMLSTLVRVHPIFAQYGLTAPIAAALRSLEGSSDSYALALATVAPSQQGAITSDQSSIDTNLNSAITTYEQICIPSPLYPIVPPVCVSL